MIKPKPQPEPEYVDGYWLNLPMPPPPKLFTDEEWDETMRQVEKEMKEKEKL